MWFESCWDRQHRTHVIGLVDANDGVDIGAGWATRPSGDPECMWHNRGGVYLATEGTLAMPIPCYGAIAYIAENVGTQRVALAHAADTYCPGAPTP